MLRRLHFALALGAVVACFQDSTDPPADGCAAGSAGCACYGNMTCDASLVCEPQLVLCIPENCTPGTDGCTCDAGSCTGDLVCDGGLCAAASGTGEDTSGNDDSQETGTDSTGPTPADSGSDGPDPNCGDSTVSLYTAGPIDSAATAASIRAEVDAACMGAILPACDVAHAVFSAGPDDEVRDMGEVYCMPTTTEVVGPGGPFAPSFDALLTDGPATDLEAAGIMLPNGQTLFWSGTGAGGAVSVDDCDGWTGSGSGAVGNTVRDDEGWIAAGPSSCSGDPRHVLCACWTAAM